MATRKKLPPQQTSKPADALVVEKESFKSKLGERINLGRQLLHRSVTDTTQLEQLESDYYKWDDYNSEYLKQTFNNEDSSYKRNYDHRNDWVGNIFGGSGSPQQQFTHLREKIGNKIEVLEKLVDKIDLLKSEIINEQRLEEKTFETTDKNNIFIVHGHNKEIQQSVARVIEKLGLTPIILSEQANNGKTIIEKFEAHSKVGFAIILMTDDDEGKAKAELEMKNRARQNVILELGYFLGKLGRSRVLPLYTDGVELPSDIHGLLYTPIDKVGTWKFAIVKELKGVGYNVDANKIL